MQGLFRNPLADPGLAGVPAGAGLGAALAIVLGDRLPQGLAGLGSSPLPAAAFIGALAATSTLYAVATRGGRTSVATMLLAGLALAALASSFIGILAYVSDDRQLCDLTFWSMGSLGGASWVKVAALAPVTAIMIAAAPFLSRGLNALALGEAEAFHLGVRLQRLKAAIVFLVAMAVGASVAAAGVISFVGIVAPHAVRLILGADHHALLPLSLAAGAILLSGADVLARTPVTPAEMPIGDLPHQLARLDVARAVARRGVAVLAILHDFNLASRYADVLALMNKGAIVACGDPDSVQRSDLLSEVFAIDLTVGTRLASQKPLVMPSRWLSEG
jgi:iron complex transport system permease protein